MYYIFSLLTGVLVSVMAVMNGGLSEHYGLYSSSVIVHITGIIIVLAVIIARKERPFAKRFHPRHYLGGAIGVLTVSLTNLAFVRISVSSLMALSLLGQTVMGIIIDKYGILGMTKHGFKKRKLIGLALMLCGIAVMIDGLEVAALVFAVIAGVSIVASRTFNAGLAARSSAAVSTFFNYFVGLAVSVVICLVSGGNEPIFTSFKLSPDVFIYLGGAVGTITVFLSTIAVSKIPAFSLSVLMFIGQVFTGVIIDIIITGEFSARNLVGGGFVAAGLCVNIMSERIKLKAGKNNV